MIPEKLKKYDFRSNLIVDPNNPILIQKAWRDHFAGKSFWQPGKNGGKAYLGVANSEDALTWNVFRSLQLESTPGLQLISDIFCISTIESLLFWGCDVEKRGEIQQLLSILIRTIDGQLKGTMTEPDLVIVTKEEVVFVECKLNLNGKQSPWRAQKRAIDKESGAERRMRSYINTGFEELNGLNWEEIYQLIRQYVYAKRLADTLRKEPVVVALINADHLDILLPFYLRAQKSILSNECLFKDIVTWQNISENILSSGVPCALRLTAKISNALEASKKRSRA